MFFFVASKCIHHNVHQFYGYKVQLCQPQNLATKILLFINLYLQFFLFKIVFNPRTYICTRLNNTAFFVFSNSFQFCSLKSFPRPSALLIEVTQNDQFVPWSLLLLVKMLLSWAVFSFRHVLYSFSFSMNQVNYMCKKTKRSTIYTMKVYKS